MKEKVKKAIEEIEKVYNEIYSKTQDYEDLLYIKTNNILLNPETEVAKAIYSTFLFEDEIKTIISELKKLPQKTLEGYGIYEGYEEELKDYFIEEIKYTYKYLKEKKGYIKHHIEEIKKGNLPDIKKFEFEIEDLLIIESILEHEIPEQELEKTYNEYLKQYIEENYLEEFTEIYKRFEKTAKEKPFENEDELIQYIADSLIDEKILHKLYSHKNKHLVYTLTKMLEEKLPNTEIKKYMISYIEESINF